MLASKRKGRRGIELAPPVVETNGNGQSYRDYDEVCNHLPQFATMVSVTMVSAWEWLQCLVPANVTRCRLRSPG
jgi:hypothetical protein